MRELIEAVRRGWHWLLGVTLFAIYLWAQSDAMVGVFYDDGIYVTLARSLAEGEGLRYLHLPGGPPAAHYPALYPFVLSLLWRINPEFPANVVLFQLFDTFALATAAVLTALYFKQRELPSASLASTLVVTFTAFPLLALVGVRFSEPLFLCLMMATLLIADQRPRRWSSVLVGLLGGLAFLARSIGIALVAGAVAGYVIRRRYRDAAISAVTSLVAIVPWGVWTMVHTDAVPSVIASSYGTYWDAAGRVSLPELLTGASPGVVAPLLRLALPALPMVLWWVAGTAIVGLIALGAVRLFGRCQALIATLISYAAVVSVWPHVPDRFVWIVLPYVGVLFVRGLADIWWNYRRFRLAVIGLLVVLFAGFGIRQFSSVRSRGFADTAERISVPFQLLVPSVVNELPADAVLASGDEALVFLYTDRKAVPVHLIDFTTEGESYIGPDR
ncbi:MAG: hypothetical protein ACE5FJ_05995, partial [Gemmatimonadales bacterium]